MSICFKHFHILNILWDIPVSKHLKRKSILALKKAIAFVLLVTYHYALEYNYIFEPYEIADI